MRLAPVIALLALAAPAWASNPTSSYVYPSKVEFIPDQATATKVIIHGAFFFYTMNFAYTKPSCGKMYFSCAQGQEAMCRMQWNEIAMVIGGQQCDGFGQWSMTPTTKLYAEGDALSTPDVWDLGMGISPGGFVDGKCAPAMQLNCSGGGSPDLGLGMATDMGSGGTTDLTSSSGDLSTSGDLAGPPLAKSGCAVAVGQRAPASSFVGLGLLGLLMVARRRRRG